MISVFLPLIASLNDPNPNMPNFHMFHMTPAFSDFIPGSLEDMDKHIEVEYVYHVTMKKKVQVRINMQR